MAVNNSWIPIDAGDLFARIQLECDTISHVNGAEVRTATVYGSAWAFAQDEGGGEAVKGALVQSVSKWNFTIRYRSDVKPQHRVIYKGMRMEIMAVHEEDQRKTQLLLQCQTYAG